MLGSEEKQKLSVKEYRYGQRRKVSPPSQQEQTSEAARRFHGLFFQFWKKKFHLCLLSSEDLNAGFS